MLVRRVTLSALVSVIALTTIADPGRAATLTLGAVDGLYQKFGTERSHFYEGAKFKVPLSRLGTWEDVGNLTAFLLSDRAAFANGGRYQLDGGAIHEYTDPRANWRAHQAQKGVRT